MSTSDTLYSLWLSVKPLCRFWARCYLTPQGVYDLDDLLQASFLAVCDTVRNHDPERGAFNTLLRFNARTRFAEVAGCRGTKRGLQCESLDTLFDGEEAYRDLPHPEAHNAFDLIIERVSAQQDVAALMIEIGKLDELPRQALLLTSWYDMTTQEASEVMGIPPDKVRQCRKSAVTRIRATSTARNIGKDYHTRHVTLSRFKTTHTSSVEEWILEQEE